MSRMHITPDEYVALVNASIDKFEIVLKKYQSQRAQQQNEEVFGLHGRHLEPKLPADLQKLLDEAPDINEFLELVVEKVNYAKAMIHIQCEYQKQMNQICEAVDIKQ